jgi:hypothetical protein
MLLLKRQYFIFRDAMMQEIIGNKVNKLSTILSPCSFIYFRLYRFSPLVRQQRRRRLNSLDGAKKRNTYCSVKILDVQSLED